MKHIKILGFLFVIILPGFALSQSKNSIQNQSIKLGETLNYKVKWGFLTIGEGTTKVDELLYKINGNTCYKVQINGQTNGIASLFYVHDKWVSYIDTADVTTHRSFRSIREGGYELDEIVNYNQGQRKAEVQVYDKKTKNYVIKKTYDTKENVRDVVAGFVIFRFMDLSKYRPGNIFTVNGFIEDESYKVDVSFEGTESVKTNKGKILCYKLKPIVPKNKVFNGQKAVTVWLSADSTRKIVQIQAKMFVANLMIYLVEP